MLELRALGKRFGDHVAVRDVSLEIREGEFFSLLGPSGCGKTTLLRMIGGLESPSEGEIHDRGSRIDGLAPNERHFNMVFQRYALFPHLSVAENVAFGLKMKRVAEPELSKRVGEALALVQMAGFEDRRIATLSGGQGQRVALARALVNRPRVLLLDEPLSALDLKLRQQMQVELMSLQRRLGHTFIFVTHDQDEALTLSDRVAVMNEGRVVQVGSPREIYDEPATAFVAGFIGSMNRVPGSLREGGALESAQGVLHARLRGTGATGEGAILVRPERVALSRAQPAEGLNRLRGVIRETMFQGPISQILVEVGGGSLAVSHPSGTGEDWKVGEQAWASFAKEDARLSHGDRLL